jgi:hypothetical protein
MAVTPPHNAVALSDIVDIIETDVLRHMAGGWMRSWNSNSINMTPFSRLHDILLSVSRPVAERSISIMRDLGAEDNRCWIPESWYHPVMLEPPH